MQRLFPILSALALLTVGGCLACPKCEAGEPTVEELLAGGPDPVILSKDRYADLQWAVALTEPLTLAPVQCPGGNCGGSSVRLFAPSACTCGPNCPAGGNCSPCLCAAPAVNVPPVGKPQLSADGKYQWVGFYDASGRWTHDAWVPAALQHATGRRVVRYDKICTGTGCKVVPVYE